MADPTVLSAWVFPSELDAQRTARRLSSAALTAPPVDDAAVVSWPADRRRPLAWQARELTTEQRLSGAFWGMLFAQLFLLPLSLQAPPPLKTAGLDETMRLLGVEPGFARAVRGGVVPGTSALFVLNSADHAAGLGRHLSADAVELGDAFLTSEQATRLHAGFDDDD